MVLAQYSVVELSSRQQQHRVVTVTLGAAGVCAYMLAVHRFVVLAEYN